MILTGGDIEPRSCSSRFDLRVHKHLMHLVDRSGRNALDLEGTQQLELRQGADLLAQDRNQRSAVPHAVGISFKSRIGRKFWEAERSRKTRELGIVAHRDNNVSIAGRECLVGHDIGMGITVAHRHLAGSKEVHPLVGQRRDLDVQQRQIDMLA